MSKILKIVLIVLVAIGITFGVGFAVSRYLVSKLDGVGQLPPQGEVTQYSSEDGISFTYPVSYELSSRAGAVGEGDVLVLTPKDSVIPEGGEAPPSITVTVVRDATAALEQWIRNDQRSNFALSTDGQLAQTTVGGENAYEYSHSGLYETDAFAVMHGGKIFLFEAGWITRADPIRLDFQRLVSSVQFTQ